MSTAIRAAAIAIAGICLVACGGAGTSSPGTSPSAAGASNPAATSSPSSGTAAAAAMALTVADLPTGGPTLAQISDGEMNSIANTDQRGFANTDNTYRIEDDVVIDASSQAATADYTQLRDAAKDQVVTLASSSMLSGLGSQADEYIGETSNGYSEVGITFQEGSVIAVLLIVDSSGTVDPTFAEAVAGVQDQKIVAAS